MRFEVLGGIEVMDAIVAGMLVVLFAAAFRLCLKQRTLSSSTGFEPLLGRVHECRRAMSIPHPARRVHGEAHRIYVAAARERLRHYGYFRSLEEDRST